MSIHDVLTESAYNTNYRKILATTKQSQIVLMAILPGQDIGTEVHKVDQYIQVLSGVGIVSFKSTGAKKTASSTDYALKPGVTIIIPAGVHHNVINTGHTWLKLSTIYTGILHYDTIERFKPLSYKDVKGLWYPVAVGRGASTADIYEFRNNSEKKMIEMVQKTSLNEDIVDGKLLNPLIAWANGDYLIFLGPVRVPEGTFTPIVLSRKFAIINSRTRGIIELSKAKLLATVVDMLGYSSKLLNVIAISI